MKAIKSFIPFRITPSFYKWCAKAAKKPDQVLEKLEPFLAHDPAAHEWTSYGLTEPLEVGNLVHGLDGAAYLLKFKFNQRVLPAVVRDQEISRRLAELRERKGDVETKQEYAQIRDEVEAALLPKAFVRPSYIPVLVYQDMIFFCTTSIRRVQEMIVHLIRLAEVRDIDMLITDHKTKDTLTWFMEQAAKDEPLESEEHDVDFIAGDAIVLKGLDKRAARFKDREVAHADVQQIINTEGYKPTEIRLKLIDADGNHRLAFTVTDRWQFKAIKLEETLEYKDSLADQHASTWYTAKELETTFRAMLNILGEAEEEEDEL